MIIKIEFKVEFESSSSYSSTEKRFLKEIEKRFKYIFNDFDCYDFDVLI